MLLLPSLALVAGCSTPITATEAKKTALAIGHVRPSRHDTCETQRAIAEQSSRIDTIANGKETVYRPAPCKAAPVLVEPKTS